MLKNVNTDHKFSRNWFLRVFLNPRIIPLILQFPLRAKSLSQTEVRPTPVVKQMVDLQFVYELAYELAVLLRRYSVVSFFVELSLLFRVLRRTKT